MRTRSTFIHSPLITITCMHALLTCSWKMHVPGESPFPCKNSCKEIHTCNFEVCHPSGIEHYLKTLCKGEDLYTYIYAMDHIHQL